jgi:hypothetical protein
VVKHWLGCLSGGRGDNGDGPRSSIAAATKCSGVSKARRRIRRVFDYSQCCIASQYSIARSLICVKDLRQKQTLNCTTLNMSGIAR